MNHHIRFLDKVQLLQRKRYTEMAIASWKTNRYSKSQKEVDYNIEFFSNQLDIINKELSKKERIEL